MGNYISLGSSSGLAGKIVFPDGTLQRLETPVTIAELMLENPNHFVIELGPDVSQNRLVPLPADHKATPNKAYLVLPMRRGNKALTPEEARRIPMKEKSSFRYHPLSSFFATYSSRKVLPLLAAMCHVDAFKEEVSMKRTKSEKYKLPELLPEIGAERPEFVSRQFSGKGWKPALDTIVETRVEKKVRHWLF
ncbi:hypothetical protein AMTR_s00057p00042470 [Amborella trichopoda]|uniref:Uncharacterized protein n=2 Tax=Amborella trichopoda TaxID=13333 RepID=U5D5P6_AMBTC|nr:hypothetical protein AMTR_s00057p00042470 [Amborella trichopoda]